ncbi:MAG: hypothetical protein Q8K75_10165 [Chlamydiales bacterium]|nr:hypothetical protein [Chlamydiales bacterium]
MSDNCCPKCGSKAFKRNGFTRHGKQNHRCLECGRQFSLEPALEDPALMMQSFQSQVVAPCFHETRVDYQKQD